MDIMNDNYILFSWALFQVIFYCYFPGQSTDNLTNCFVSEITLAELFYGAAKSGR